MKKKATSISLNVLIIGAGMYVCGRGTKGYGTVFPALCELQRRGFPLRSIYLTATSPDSIDLAGQKLDALNKVMGTDLSLITFPEQGEGLDPENYLKVLQYIKKPACAVVVVPDHLHCKIAGDCLKAGLHVLVVKPLAPTVKEAKVLIDLQKEKNLYGAVEFHKRFDRANLKLKEVIQHGKLGHPLYFIVEFSQRKSIPSEVFAEWVKYTNIFQYLGVHYVDIIHFATHAVPKRVMAIGQNGWLKENGFQTYDAVHATVEWEDSNGYSFFSYLFTNWIDPESTSAMSNQKIKVIGTKGRFESDQKMRGLSITTDEGGIEEVNPDFCNTYPAEAGAVSYQGYGIESIHNFLKDVSGIIQNHVTIDSLEKARPTFSDSLPATAVVEAVNKSLENNGAWVEVTY